MVIVKFAAHSFSRFAPVLGGPVMLFLANGKPVQSVQKRACREMLFHSAFQAKSIKLGAGISVGGIAVQ
jgi:hypothetical protein